jgi:hypothetical protein
LVRLAVSAALMLLLPVLSAVDAVRMWVVVVPGMDVY